MSKIVVNDLIEGAKLYRFWFYSAYVKLQLEHQKTRLSFLWEPITVFFVAIVISTVWSRILQVESKADYFFYVLIGFSLWSLLIAKLVNRAMSALARRSSELNAVARPISWLYLEEIGYSFLNFFVAFPFIFIASSIYFELGVVGICQLILGLLLVWLAAMGLCFSLGVLVFFFRDLLHIVNAVMRLGFLITPIIWRPERLGEYEYLVVYNPFYSFIDICRAPLMASEPRPESWLIAIGITITLLAMGFLVQAIFNESIRRKIFL